MKRTGISVSLCLKSNILRGDRIPYLVQIYYIMHYIHSNMSTVNFSSTSGWEIIACEPK
jgi:hypothetical protein